MTLDTAWTKRFHDTIDEVAGACHLTPDQSLGELGARLSPVRPIEAKVRGTTWETQTHRDAEGRYVQTRHPVSVRPNYGTGYYHPSTFPDDGEDGQDLSDHARLAVLVEAAHFSDKTPIQQALERTTT